MFGVGFREIGIHIRPGLKIEPALGEVHIPKASKGARERLTQCGGNLVPSCAAKRGSVDRRAYIFADRDNAIFVVVVNRPPHALLCPS
ncbi:hypothetical protein D9M70_554110 [compost metagenome]